MFLICGEALFDVFAENSEDNSASTVGLDAVAGGSPFNVSFGLARLDKKSALLAGISSDFLGERLVNILEREGVDRRYLVRKEDCKTTLAMVAVKENGSPSYSFYHEGGADRMLEPSDLPRLDDDIKAIHVGSYSLVVSPTSESLAELIDKEGEDRLVTFDPNIRLNVEEDIKLWREKVSFFAARADFIKVSDEDLELLYGDSEGSGIAEKWLEGRTSLVVITRGSEGVSAYSASGRIDLAIDKVDVVDAVGAGDTFQAATLCWLDEHDRASREGVAGLGEDEIKALVEFANKAAGITCTRQGPDLPHRRDLDQEG